MQKIFTNTRAAVMLLFMTTAFYTTQAQEVDTVEVTGAPGATAVTTVTPPAGSITIKGIVKDASTGKALPGIQLSIPGYSSSITDDQGAFSIFAPAYNVTLIMQGEGYQAKEVAVKGRKEITVSLHEDKFTSVYRTATLQTRQQPLSHVVNSVVSINTTNSFRTSADTPENYFQGMAPGLNMIRRSGTPGIGAFMSLRGFNSLYATNQPLVVVDGMIFDMNDYGGSLINNYFSNPLEYIDIKDIDNITVVKDATSLYGSKGANGALFITTGHAQDLTTRIDFSTYTGVNFTPRSLPVMKAGNYRTYISDVLKSAGYSDSYIQSQPYMNDDPTTPGYYQYHNNTDWQSKVFKASYNQNYYLRVTGGDNIAKYSLSLGHLDHGGIVRGTGYKRYNTRFNADLNISPRLTGNTNLSFTYGEHKLVEEGLSASTNPMFVALIKSPLSATNVISDEGLTSPNLADIDIFNVSNPVQITREMIATNKNYRFFGNINFSYRVADNLHISNMFGLTYDKVRENLFIPRMGVIPDTLYNALAESRMGAQLQRMFALYNDTRVAYDRTFAQKHTASLRAGFRLLTNKSEEDYGLGYNSATDDLITIGTGSSTLRQVGGNLGKWVWLNYYAGLDYHFLNKYFVSANLAIDGSSRFGKEAPDGITLYNNRFGVFPSLGAGWIVSSEPFMAGADFVELLKLRVNYGITGNDDIGNYSSKQYYVSQNLLGMEGLVRGNIANPALQWETVKKLNAGIDISLMNERISLSMDVFSNKTDNMLAYQRLETVAGFDYVLTNGGSMENKGVEVALSSRVLDRDYKLDLALNLATYQNKMTRMPGGDIETNYAGATILTRTGLPVGVFYGYRTSGVFVSDEQAAAYSMPANSGALVPFNGGDVRFNDLTPDHVIDANDRTVIGDPNPDFTGMFSARFAWKQLTVDAAMTFSYGNDVYNYTRAQLESMKGMENQTNNVLNRWRANGQVTNTPRAVWGDPMGNARFSDRWIEDGSYLRLRTLSVSYDLPFRTQKLKYASVYITGNNLLTFTHYLGYDPEFSPSNNVLLQGINTTQVPQFRSVMLGVRIGL